MESFLTDLKKDVQCSLCNDTLTQPKILKCFHTFCKPCIKRHAELIEEVNVFKCPQCKSLTPLPELSSEEDLKPSVLHSRMLKGLALAEGRKVCSVSDSHSSASWYCFDCDRSMCDECEQSHSVFTKDHKVVCLVDLKKEDIEVIITRENHCKDHPNQRLELFCEECDALICLTCWKHQHTDHKLLKLDKFTSLKRNVLAKHLEVLDEFTIDESHKKEQEEIAETMKKDGERAKKEVKKKTKKMIEILQENEQELLKQIDKKLDIANRNLNIIQHVPAVKEYINNVMERGLASEMMDIRETECTEGFVFCPLPHTRFVFVPNELLAQQVNTGIGKLKSQPKTDHTMSTIQVKGEPEALTQQKLILITKTSEGKLNYDPADVVDVKISPEGDVVTKKKSVTTDGKIEVEFMAKVAGQLTAEVQVNGNHVSNSPLVMNVKPQKMTIRRQFKMKGLKTQPKKVTGVAVNKENSRIAVADVSAHCVYVFNTNGDLLLTYGSQGSGKGQLNGPRGLVFLNNTDLVIADWSNDRICIVNTTTGTLVKTFGNRGNGDGEFDSPNGVHIDDDGNILVSDTSNHRVQVFTRDGDYQYQFGLTTQENFGPVSTATHGGRFYVSDLNNHVIHVFEKKNGVPTRVLTISGKGSADGQLSLPFGLAIDNDHHLVVCDYMNNRIQKFTLDGRFIGKTFEAAIKRPMYVTVMNDGQLLVTCFNTGEVYFVE